MIRAVRIALLEFRARVIEGDIEARQETLARHERMLSNDRLGIAACQNELRRLQMEIGRITPASTLLAQALRRTR
jgi:hypothetical protein